MKKIIRILFLFLSVVSITIFVFYLIAFFTPISNFGDNNRIRIFDINQELFYESNNSLTSSWISYDEIPQEFVKAIISIEDQHYFQHFGFDPLRIAKALYINIREQAIIQGGSTITQQYAKNQYLTNERTWTRKLKEAFLSAQLETHFTKEQIFEGYVNTLYFGHGIYGIKDASYFFFDKPLLDLSIAEIAILAAIPNGPGIYSPYINYDNAIYRQHIILDTMLHNHSIDEITYQNAINEPILLKKYDESYLSQSSLSGYYRDAAIQHTLDMGYINKDDNFYSIDIYTYYNPEIQEILVNQIQKHNMDQNMEVAAVILEPYTGHLLAVVGGKDYSISQFNRAFYSKRQVASTIKPLLYYLALQEGFSPSTTFLSKYTTFQISENETYAPTNYSHVYADEPISLINAISLSDNVYAMKTHMYLGTSALQNALKHFDIQVEANASLALGTASFPILKLAEIYNTFASEGIYTKSCMISKIVNHKNEVLFEDIQESSILLNQNDTLILNQLLRSTYDIKNNNHLRATMLGYEPNVTTAAKSGTSDWDSIVVGFNPQYTIAIWNGYDDNQPMTQEAERKLSKLIFKDTFNKLYENSDSNPWYQLTDKLHARKVNPITGELSSFGSWYWYYKNDMIHNQQSNDKSSVSLE